MSENPPASPSPEPHDPDAAPDGGAAGSRTRVARRRRHVMLGAATAVVLGLSGAYVVSANGTEPAGRAATCLVGTLTYRHHDVEAGTHKPVVTSVARNTDWELWGRPSGQRKARLLGSGTTDRRNGTFKACYKQAGSLAEAYMKFRSGSGKLWRAIDPKSKKEFTFTSKRLHDVSGPRNLGTVQAPAAQQGAWKIVDTVNELYRTASAANPAGTACWTTHQVKGKCDRLTYTWAPDAKEGGYWDQGGTNFVVLTAEDADSRHTILHEAGHWYQWQLYDHWFPEVTDCDNHTFEKASSTSCAWTEAFADAVAAYSLGDYRYVYSDGMSFDLHNDPTTRWDRGDATQGRVGSSLLDLWAKGGPDGGNWNRTIRMMSKDTSGNFREFFTVDRPAAGLSTTGRARDILLGHTITY